MRTKKVSKSEILECIKENGWIEVWRLADIFQVHLATIRARIKELEIDKQPIISSRYGYKYIKSLSDIEDANIILGTENWITAILQALVRKSRIIRPRIAQAVKFLDLNYDERYRLKKQLRQIIALIDIADINEEYK